MRSSRCFSCSIFGYAEGQTLSTYRPGYQIFGLPLRHAERRQSTKPMAVVEDTRDCGARSWERGEVRRISAFRAGCEVEVFE